MSFHVILPARYQSTRLPGKPLALIGETPMIIHVCEKAKLSGAASVSVATDDQRIFDCVKDAGFNPIMTHQDHPSGSDRIFEAAQHLKLNDSDVIVNVQGDEPFIPPQNIAQVADLLKPKMGDKEIGIASLCCAIETPQQLNNPDCVKVVLDKNQMALYFSRSAIPYQRDVTSNLSADQVASSAYRHIGIYAYRYSFLSQYINWPESDLEKIEKLEQLRVLSQGQSIKMGILNSAPQNGVDNPTDLKAANEYYQLLKNRIE
ncbi:MAG: 3-deoxy-manno-octulosonate cytidylyltransferase [Enterobacterales bacterium]|nr:3-deoxy-manno-octulosonate cytidylyltransferase [Enterobacterales bacterium]